MKSSYWPESKPNWHNSTSSNGLEVELLARIKAQLALREYQEELKLANRKLLDINRELRTSQEKLELAAKTDPLTRLSNRRDMIEKIEHEISRFKRGQKPFSLVLSDIDDFKHFNDTFGHDCGDFILVTVANIMKSMIRSQDRVARWGGEEFLFLFPETNLEGGRVVAEKIRAHIAGAVYTYKQHALSITLTFGVSVFYSEFLTTDDCIKYADQAMYIGKEHGKNCVIVSPEQESTEMEGENED
jgi:diguanylate cyclase (GGDEF)-like protein